MKLYILDRNGQTIGWDEYDSFVVCAISPESARMLAYNKSGDEGSVWLDKWESNCKELKVSDVEKIVIGSFNAG